MEMTSISVTNHVIKDSLCCEGVTLLTYEINYPEFNSCRFRTCLYDVNRYYKNKALAFKRYCKTELFCMAVQQYRDALKNGFPVHTFEAMEVYKVTYSQDCIISVYSDRYTYTGGAHGNTVRQSQTWNLQWCNLMKLNHMVCCPPDYKSYILSKVEAQISEDPDIYFENYHELAAQTFDPNNFYCTPEAIVFYYQQYDIAPYASGIREFTIPYSRCVMNPLDLCC